MYILTYRDSLKEKNNYCPLTPEIDIRKENAKL